MDDLEAIVEANEQLFSESEVASAAEALGLDDQLAKGRDQFTFDRILPPDLAAAVELISEPYPVDGLSGSVILLNNYSGLNKIKTRIYSDETSSVHPNSYVAGIGVTGLAKTPILDELGRKPVAPLQAEAFEDWRRQCEQWEVSCREQKLKKADRPPKPKPLILQHNNITDPALVLWLEHHSTKGVGTHLTFDERLVISSPWCMTPSVVVEQRKPNFSRCSMVALTSRSGLVLMVVVSFGASLIPWSLSMGGSSPKSSRS